MDSRRHDVDWLRVIALGLLIAFHVNLSFQPWAHRILFIQNDDSWSRPWFLVNMLDIWRIPLLFLISGMGVYFAMRGRDWKELLQERTKRILVPFVFGFLLICPISIFISQLYYGQPLDYTPNSGHLWFLANLFAYVLLLIPLIIYQRNNPDNIITRTTDRLLESYGGFFLFLLPLMIEAALLNPEHFSSYSRTLLGLPTAHGFLYGLLCFALGFLLVSRGDIFWNAAQRALYIALAIAVLLYAVRFLVFKFEEAPNALIALESGCWMLVMLALGSLFLNRPSNVLRYLSKAVFPVYILHLPVLFGLGYVLFPLDLPVAVKLPLLLAGTFAVSLVLYEVLRQLLWLRLRPLFGMSMPESKTTQGALAKAP